MRNKYFNNGDNMFTVKDVKNRFKIPVSLSKKTTLKVIGKQETVDCLTCNDEMPNNDKCKAICRFRLFEKQFEKEI